MMTTGMRLRFGNWRRATFLAVQQRTSRAFGFHGRTKLECAGGGHRRIRRQATSDQPGNTGGVRHTCIPMLGRGRRSDVVHGVPSADRDHRLDQVRPHVGTPSGTSPIANGEQGTPGPDLGRKPPPSARGDLLLLREATIEGKCEAKRKMVEAGSPGWPRNGNCVAECAAA